MKNSIVFFFLFAFLPGVLFVGGCDLAKPQHQNQQRQPVVQEGVGVVDMPQNPPEQAEPATKEDNTILVKAETGVGSKGSSYEKPTGGPMDIIAVPISAGFRAKERISFLLIDDAMNKFKAEYDRVPESHEEFMEKIVRPGGIMLPQLPPGEEYVYDPTDGVLKVRKPKNAP